MTLASDLIEGIEVSPYLYQSIPSDLFSLLTYAPVEASYRKMGLLPPTFLNLVLLIPVVSSHCCRSLSIRAAFL